ncbi:response regulator [Hylemonella gracilis]|uniref:Response regulator n=2 Tax=Hylemonella gracilis TaxID=80880 RepID=A0A4P6UFN4_9BURK|nr:response regulator [Hylemonella gracilis]
MLSDPKAGAGSAAHADPAAQKKTILVVDDTADNLSLLAGLLKDVYRVRLANSGEKALAALASGDDLPDLILLDVMMPGMSGYEVCERLKGDARTQAIPVIFLTGMSSVEDESKGLALGAADYITKPVSPPILLARVQTQLLMRDALGLLEAQNIQLGDQVRRTGLALGEARAKLAKLVEIGIALGRDTDRQALMQRAMLGARDIANCEAVSLFMRTSENTLRIAFSTHERLEAGSAELPLEPPRIGEGSDGRDRVAQRVARTGATVVVNDARLASANGLDLDPLRRLAEAAGLSPLSVLGVPLKPRDGKVIGVILMINAQDSRTGVICPFDPEIIGFTEALAAQTAVALENHELLDAQKNLTDSMIQMLAGAIDTKSPYTGGHCARVPELAFMLAEEAERVREGPLADFAFKSEQEWREFRIGAWLHDCGKITTPEYVVDKATKLETIVNRIHEIRTRFEILLRDAKVQELQALLAGTPAEQARGEFEARKAQLLEDFTFVADCNLGSESMDEAHVVRLRKIAQETWLRHFDDRLGLSHEELRLHEKTARATLPVREQLLADQPHHLIERQKTDEEGDFKLKPPPYLYNRGELYNLSIQRGTLNAEERFKINEHIIQTIRMLERMPLPDDLKRVPEYAGTHHETLTGSGYPRGLSAAQLSTPARIMAIADIFEALTARDRPYQKAKSLSKAVEILHQFKRKGHIDPVLFDLFLSSGVYLTYARRYLDPAQIDAVDIRNYLG